MNTTTVARIATEAITEYTDEAVCNASSGTAWLTPTGEIYAFVEKWNELPETTLDNFLELVAEEEYKLWDAKN